jgi:hypothetical protein
LALLRQGAVKAEPIVMQNSGVQTGKNWLAKEILLKFIHYYCNYLVGILIIVSQTFSKR